MSRPLVGDPQAAKLAGVACIVVGAFLLYDAYDARGKSRPFALRFLPG